LLIPSAGHALEITIYNNQVKYLDADSPIDLLLRRRAAASHLIRLTASSKPEESTDSDYKQTLIPVGHGDWDIFYLT
jgi:hypothetical protein